MRRAYWLTVRDKLEELDQQEANIDKRDYAARAYYTLRRTEVSEAAVAPPLSVLERGTSALILLATVGTFIAALIPVLHN